ncbi:nucleotide-binding, alpha-beta plait [Aspergillus terreus]|uniref:Nucleotide-binding, alpha-beta plait n=1 Tax=Aspergillus terreus TaxID=33178 RepID=A0A5M3YRH4_ASPTE|nr:hypothetical protein ATETN484_0002049200 [Aspergillus terreus]GFF15348.1 nucleotide-binding, alpha-beta plait [Aspergillus terreus]
MTPSPPDEAFQFRGETLTPESPRPLHIAEPANIPVLQNQMDPVFNDTSTYEKSDSALGISSQAYHNGHGSREDGYTHPAEGSGHTSWLNHPGQPPPPAQHQQHTQGSSHSDPLRMDKMSSTNAPTSSSATPSAPSARPMAPATWTPVPDAQARSSLTTLPPPDITHTVPNVPPPSSHVAQHFPNASAVGPAVNNWAPESVPQDRPDAQGKVANSTGEDGVDFQNLLDNLPPSTTAAPSADAVPQAPTDEAQQSSPGLPPRPPPQEKPSIHPNYQPSDDIRSYHQIPPPNSSSPSSYSAQQSNYQSNVGAPPLAAAGAPGTSSAGASALPPPPGPSFQQSSPAESPGSSPGVQRSSRGDRQPARSGKDEDTPWGPEVQKKYDEFLHDERVYVTEGLWDRFPPGSRLFVGNLPTERVTKRDLFHIFHKYGKLAQISIKQAYGFIQFLESSACKQALDVEQGAVVRGRKVHPVRPLQSRPALHHRDARDLPSSVEAVLLVVAIPEPPEIGTTDRMNRDASRSAIFGMNLHIADGTIIGHLAPHHRGRSEEEMATALGTELQSARAFDADSELPVPRRNPRDVPEVQILVLEEVDRNFIFYVENAFRSRGLRVDVLMLGPRIPLNAAVQRQIIEGVLAVIRLARPNQFSRKIPLQVFDRTGGPDNVRFNEYPDVDPNVAAEIVFHATQSLQRGGPPTPFPPNAAAFGVPPLAPAPIPQAPLPPLTNPPNLANLITSLDGPTLQSLLAALQQRPPAIPTAQPTFAGASAPHSGTDLASLLSAATRPAVPANPHQPLPPQSFPLQAPNAPAVSDPNLISLLAKGLGGQQPQSQAGVSPHVQNIMNQLGKWKQ